MTLALGGKALPGSVARRKPATELLPTILVLLLATLALAPSILGQQYDPSLYSGIEWRQIGPFRAGRVTGVTGVPGQPAVYYMGTAGGGAWKTTDGGMVWKPIFDKERVASIGAIAVAPSNPNVVYIGTGDVSNVGGSVNQGNGMWKSTDAGESWQHLGLEDSRHIGAIWVDPKNASIVFAAALGHTYAPNAERGIFKTTDGGNTWKEVLYKDDTTGGIDVAFAPDNPKIGFATLWYHYVKPDTPFAGLMGMGGAGIYKTTDGGETWTPITIPQLANAHLGRIGVVVAPGGQRVFAIVTERRQGGLYRSDDGGSTWKRITQDPRIQGNGYFSKVFLDPHNSDIVFVAQTSLYRSTDGGMTFESYKGAPGGDDNHALWIDPTNSDYMIMGSDQGATISMDGGKSWSSWYNQPTGQIYHVSTDNRFPYWVYGTQQDSGSVATLSRGDYGAITFLDWDPIGGYEFGYILPSPTDPNIIYTGGEARGLWRTDRSSRQVKVISPNLSRDGDYRTATNVPLAFSPQNPHLLYEGTQFLLQTTDEGATWKAISPDLAARPGEPSPPSAEEENKAGANKGEEAKTNEAENKRPKAQEEQETMRPPDRRALTTIAPSALKAGVIWVGTNDGLVQLTTDNGANWQNVSPPGLQKFSEVTMVEASHFDPATAYVSVDNHQGNDFRPHIFRTRDCGKTWQEVVSGIPDFSFVKVVREDPQRKGLLYAGTETGAFVSFDDGDRWGTLQQNMPTVSVRDMVVHGDDLVAATYGRAFWILDDLTPLRQINEQVAKSQVHLFRPETAIRLRNDMNQDTPLPPEMSAGDNPPSGAGLDYYFKSAPSGDVTIAIYDEKGQLVRQLSSTPEPVHAEEPPPVPNYWLYHPTPLPKNAGMNRYVFDLRYPAPDAVQHTYPISALYQSTHAEPQGPFVVPGKYEVRLTIDGKTYTQPLTVEMDPRVKVTQAELKQQLDFAQKIDSLISLSYSFHEQAAKFQSEVAHRQAVLQINEQALSALQAVKDFYAKVLKIQGEAQRGFPMLGKPKPTFTLMNSELAYLSEAVNQADAAPTDAMHTAYHDYCHDLTKLAQQWSDLMKQDLPALNAQLTEQHLQPLPATMLAGPVPACEP
ncbi:MAG: hypothetical protein ABSD98_08985 [Candidatus Korobacteraceae bacterium]|jgi:photosystem II stability/assembly factor-like uncharacterized protein